MTPATRDLQSAVRCVSTALSACGIVLAFLLSPLQLRAQSASTQPTPPPVQETAPGKKSEPAQQAPSGTPPKRHKVITNDDIEAQHPSRPLPAREVVVHRDNQFYLNCDADCERQAKDLLQYDADQEANWQFQITGARRDLAKDNEWRGLLWQLMQQSSNYCNLQKQQLSRLAPSGNDFHSSVVRAKQEQYFQSMGASLRQALDATTGRINGRIREVSDLFPVRASMMQVQVSRIQGLRCEDLPHQ